MDVHAKLAELRRVVEEARSMPMSASAVVNRAELLGADRRDLRRVWRPPSRTPQQVVAERDAVVAGGRQEADQIVEDARRSGTGSSPTPTSTGSPSARPTTIVDQARAEADAAAAGDRRLRRRQARATSRSPSSAPPRPSAAAGSGSPARSVFDELTPDEVDQIKLPEHLDD